MIELDIEIIWKKVLRGMPKGRRYANDLSPTIEETLSDQVMNLMQEVQQLIKKQGKND